MDSAQTKVTAAHRFYDKAEAVIKVDKGGEKPNLNGRQLLAVEVTDKGRTIYSPQSPLTSEQLELIDLPGDSLLIEALLPPSAVAVGATWKHSDQLLASLLGLDAVSASEVQSELTEVKDGLAKMSLTGTVQGAAGGVSSEMEIKAKYDFNLKQKRITWFALLIKEKRGVGHIGPGLDVVAKLIMTIESTSESKQLTATAIAALPKKSLSEATQMTVLGPGGKWRLAHDRAWHVTTADPAVTILRMVDRGELVAQCNISPLPPQGEKPLPLAEFQADIQKSLGQSFGQFVHAAETTRVDGSTVYRVVAEGIVSQLPMRWVYYHITGKDGQRVALAFTLESELVERFAEADRKLATGLSWTNPAETAKQQPTLAR